MKTNQKLIVKLITLGLLVSLVGVFTQCVPTNTKQIGGSSSNSFTPPPLDNDQDEGQQINNLQVSEGIKSHEQILHTMSALTGVPATNASVKNVYDQVATTLPTDNDIKVFLPPHQLAITKLAAEFCKVLVDTTAVPLGKPVTPRAAIWPGFNFGALHAVALDPAGRDTMIEQTIEAFWGGMSTPAETSAAIMEFNQLIDDLLVNEPNSTNTTRNVVKGVCTSALSSAYVTLL
ncbi:MAG: hypothetical protein H0V66_07285 [Bdellovibrionales bacterium]|nr:hypothetical protein [Bdellovibrionales bacterium]